jgi:NAD(P)-dependent dehydrogenase (short-subunit alcohol dehydrogenase family)
MGNRFHGQVALVTGAAGAGIGQATAWRLARDGATVVVTDVHDRRTTEVVAAMRGSDLRAHGFILDVSDRVAIDKTVTMVEAEIGPIRILVNNAAVNPRATILDAAGDDWDRTLDVDLSGPWHLTRAVASGMVTAGGGAIVNVTSAAAYLGSPGAVPYAAAKAALQALTRSAAVELGPHGVRCNAVAPGLIMTRYLEAHAERFKPDLERTPLGRFGRPEDVADVITFLASDDARFVTGEIVTVSGGFYLRP